MIASNLFRYSSSLKTVPNYIFGFGTGNSSLINLMIEEPNTESVFDTSIP